MKKVLVINTSQTVGGNGDTLCHQVMQAAKKNGAQVVEMNIRDYHIQACKMCNHCRGTGICSIDDDFVSILKEAHNADAILISSPVYYYYLISQAVMMLGRMYVTFGTPYQLGKKKKIGIILTCSGSSPEAMTKQMEDILNLGSLQRSISEYKVEVFTHCDAADTCKKNEHYLERAALLGDWFSA